MTDNVNTEDEIRRDLHPSFISTKGETRLHRKYIFRLTVSCLISEINSEKNLYPEFIEHRLHSDVFVFYAAIAIICISSSHVLLITFFDIELSVLANCQIMT